MRLFVAIDIDDDVKKRLKRLQDNISQQCPSKQFDVKWVLPENMHLTLKFLGEVDNTKSLEVCRIVESVAAEKNAFELGFGSVGSFGGRSASVVWVGMGVGVEKLQDLQKDLENKFVRDGWAGDNKTFSGHLTLCRVKNPKTGYKLKRICDSYKDFNAGSVFVDSIAVYCSQLTSDGPVYSVIGRYKLQ